MQGSVPHLGSDSLTNVEDFCWQIYKISTKRHRFKDHLCHTGFDKQIFVLQSEILMLVCFLGPGRTLKSRLHIGQDILCNQPKGSYVWDKGDANFFSKLPVFGQR